MPSDAGTGAVLPPPDVASLSSAEALRLRAALRLLFRPDDADDLAAPASAAGDGERGLAAAMRAAERRYALGRLLQRVLPRLVPTPAQAPLAPPTGASPRGAVALAVHLALNLDVEALADLTEDSPERLGELLLQARRAASGFTLASCREFSSAVGRHRDRSLDPGSRAALFRHARECPTCRAALAASETLDADLLQAIGTATVGLPPWSPAGRSARPFRRALSVAGAGVLIVAVTLALTALVEGMRGPRGSPAAPAPAGSGTNLSGWLLTTTSDGAVTGLNLETGALRPIAAGVANGRYIRRLLSPDGRLIASWTPPYGPNGPEPTGTLTVDRVDGTTVRSWGLGGGPGPGAGAVVGWLGNSAVLIVQAPPWQSDQSQQRNLATGAHESQLLALDVNTGDARLLFQGSISSASASPDGTRVVVVQAYDQRWRGFTVELRALGPDGLGAPLATIDHRLSPGSSPVWAPDSSRVYLTRIADGDPSVPATPIGSANIFTSPTSTQIDALDRDGHETVVVPAAPDRLLYPVSVSAPDARLVYVQQRSAPAGATGQVWMAHADGTLPVAVVETAVPAGLNVAWLPDGSALVRDDLPFFLPVDPAERALGSVNWPVLLQVSPDGVIHPAGAAPTATAAVGWLGWEPPGALADATAARRGAPSVPVASQPEAAGRAGALLDASGAASPDGRLVILSDPALPGGVIWDTSSGTDSRVLRGATDLSWVPGTQTLIGVSRTGGDGAGASRVTLFASRLAGAPGLDFRHFDPAGIGSARDRHYARPLVAPDGLSISVVVVDDTHGTAELWIGSWDGAPRAAARWTAAAPALGSVPPAAVWVSADVLLYAEPSEWQNGLPQAVAINRVVVGSHGVEVPATVAVVRAHGSDRGVMVTDLAVSPDGRRIAWRVRHLTQSDATSGLYDTIDVAPLEHLAGPVEVVRAGPGDGLGWSPDGRWLAAGIGGRISLLAPDGSASVPLSAVGPRASFPIWVGSGEVWFSVSDPAGTRTMRVQLR